MGAEAKGKLTLNIASCSGTLLVLEDSGIYSIASGVVSNLLRRTSVGKKIKKRTLCGSSYVMGKFCLLRDQGRITPTVVVLTSCLAFSLTPGS